MCENIYKNSGEKQRKEEFTRLFAALASNSLKSAPFLLVNGKEKRA